PRPSFYGSRREHHVGSPTPVWDDFVVIVIDAHNGLQIKDSIYAGLEYRSPAGRTMFEEYSLFMDELASFSQVVYGYSPCYERFDMNPRLEVEAHACAAIANSFGHISYDLSEVWVSIKTLLLEHGECQESGEFVASY
ncbi:MAG: hypothetical protein ACKPKO_56045, partial [Candidatus Fonsibacter sp.]